MLVEFTPANSLMSKVIGSSKVISAKVLSPVEVN